MDLEKEKGRLKSKKYRHSRAGGNFAWGVGGCLFIWMLPQPNQNSPCAGMTADGFVVG
ncbi:hypothetical protein [Neisseria subflava]|uniref:hypothetical protein n=1 Tax=Neisseria subflava TaxID=28449 RepID=UPI0001A772E1|nr:hypothetical protein [Neisseria subflava]EER56419.1 hypothetical protein NEIFL0001_0399 [Neisseria flavescens SK114]